MTWSIFFTNLEWEYFQLKKIKLHIRTLCTCYNDYGGNKWTIFFHFRQTLGVRYLLRTYIEVHTFYVMYGESCWNGRNHWLVWQQNLARSNSTCEISHSTVFDMINQSFLAKGKKKQVLACHAYCCCYMYLLCSTLGKPLLEKYMKL